MDHRQYATNTRPCIILRFIVIFLSVIVTILCGLALPYTTRKYDWEFYADGLGAFYIAMAFGPTAFNMVWEPIALGLTFGKVNFHPAIDIGFETFAWGLCLGYGPAMIAWNSYYNYTSVMCQKFPNGPSPKCPWYKAMDGYMYGSGALLLLCGCFNLTLFVLACKATHLRRIAKENPPAAPRKEYNSIELANRPSV